ncbi:hypothetical protein EB796_019401 [Bugula neritina]|uniref:EGF-like domain-containing protein n=1 Tax=Bugula neritina TaxID=10212 RepID=A0A7J7J9P4_BUGNE|nr:hypothetical protein EB796_019401 [Bugula neritina]
MKSLSFQGDDCTRSVDDCTGVDCNHGTCIDGHLNFTCQCDTGYTGVECDIELSACDWMPCVANQTAECIATPPLQYSCVCLLGYHGNTCDLDIDECSSSPCRNGGNCFNLVDRFVCQCATGWTGATCQVNIDDCKDGPCAGNSQCVDKVGNYTCICSPGLTGNDCDVDIDECADRPCMFDSVCVEPQPGTYECLCPDHLTGLHCEILSAATLLGSTHLSCPPLSDDIISIEFKFNTPLSSTLLYLTVNEESYQGMV